MGACMSCPCVKEDGHRQTGRGPMGLEGEQRVIALPAAPEESATNSDLSPVDAGSAGEVEASVSSAAKTTPTPVSLVALSPASAGITVTSLLKADSAVVGVTCESEEEEDDDATRDQEANPCCSVPAGPRGHITTRLVCALWLDSTDSAFAAADPVADNGGDSYALEAEVSAGDEPLDEAGAGVELSSSPITCDHLEPQPDQGEEAGTGEGHGQGERSWCGREAQSAGSPQSAGDAGAGAAGAEDTEEAVEHGGVVETTSVSEHAHTSTASVTDTGVCLAPSEAQQLLVTLVRAAPEACRDASHLMRKIVPTALAAAKAAHIAARPPPAAVLETAPCEVTMTPVTRPPLTVDEAQRLVSGMRAAACDGELSHLLDTVVATAEVASWALECERCYSAEKQRRQELEGRIGGWRAEYNELLEEYRDTVLREEILYQSTKRQLDHAKEVHKAMAATISQRGEEVVALRAQLAECQAQLRQQQGHASPCMETLSAAPSLHVIVLAAPVTPACTHAPSSPAPAAAAVAVSPVLQPAAASLSVPPLKAASQPLAQEQHQPLAAPAAPLAPLHSVMARLRPTPLLVHEPSAGSTSAPSGHSAPVAIPVAHAGQAPPRPRVPPGFKAIQPCCAPPSQDLCAAASCDVLGDARPSFSIALTPPCPSPALPRGFTPLCGPGPTATAQCPADAPGLEERSSAASIAPTQRPTMPPGSPPVCSTGPAAPTQRPTVPPGFQPLSGTRTAVHDPVSRQAFHPSPQQPQRRSPATR